MSLTARIQRMPVNNTTVELYRSGISWVFCHVQKESSGAVVCGTDSDLQPLSSGRGRNLAADLPTYFMLPPDTTLYAASQDMQEVSCYFCPLDFIPAIVDLLQQIADKLQASAPPAEIPVAGPMGDISGSGMGGGSGTGVDSDKLGTYRRKRPTTCRY